MSLQEQSETGQRHGVISMLIFGATGAASSAASFVGIAPPAECPPPPPCPAASCKHVDKGLSEVISQCSKGASGTSAELIERLTIQVASLAESVSSLEDQLTAANAHKKRADAAVKAAEASAAAASEALARHLDQGPQCEGPDVHTTARFGAGCPRIEAQLKVALAGAEDAKRKQRRLTAKLQARLPRLRALSRLRARGIPRSRSHARPSANAICSLAGRAAQPAADAALTTWAVK